MTRGVHAENMIQITPQGQITIPHEIQQQLGLLPGTEVQLEVAGDVLLLRKKLALSRGLLLVEAMRGKATNRASTDDIMQLTRDHERPRY